MKRLFRHASLLWVLIAVVSLGLSSCSDDDDDTGVIVPTYPDNALVSEKVAIAPTDDATVDALWSSVEGLDIPTVVAEYNFTVDGHDIWWDDYEGMVIDLTMKSVYTDDNIYFLATWNDAEDSKMRQAWYYNQTGEKWLQMGKKYPDEFGNPPAYEDKFTVFWDISLNNFENTGCAVMCHGSHMASNSDGELADIWHWKRDRTAPVNQLDDKWLNNDENGRHSDEGTGAYSANNQQLVTSAGPTVTAPMYWIPGRTDYHWIMQSEIDTGVAKLIVDINVDGNYVDEDDTVLDKTLFGFDSNLVIPSLMGIQPATGSRGDVSAWHNWANGTWTLKIKRARNTGAEDDVQFIALDESFWFSVGIMDAAAIAHATPDGFAGTAFQLILAP